MSFGFGFSNPAWQTLAASGGPVAILNMDFTSASTFSPLLSQTSRGSNATMYDSQGRLVWAPANMITDSSASSGAANGTVGASVITAPDGSIFRQYTANGTNNQHYSASQSVSSVAGMAYTLSAVVYSATSGKIQLFTATASNATAYANFDLVAGTYVIGGSALAASMVSVSSGGWRISISLTSGTTSVQLYYGAISSMADGRTASIVSTDVLITGMYQVEPYGADSPKAFISTSGSAYYGNRFDTDPFTLQPLGLLLEEARTNLLQSSANLSGSPWSGSNATTVATAYGVLGPDGLTCQSCTENSTSAYIKQTMPIASPTTDFICCSGYFKYGSGGSFIVLQIDDPTGSHGVRCWFDIVNGLVKSSTTFGTGTYSGASIQPLTNGWFRCTLTAKLGASGSSPARMFNWCAPADGNTVSANGSLSYRYGLQIESGAATSFATSYIPTYGTSTATRSADNTPYMSATGIYNYLGGTAVCEYSQPPIPTGAGGQTAWMLSDNTVNNCILSGSLSGGTTHQPNLYSIVGGVTQAALTNPVGSNNTAVRQAVAWATNDFYTYDSKGSSASSGTGTVPGNGVITTLSFGLNNGIGVVAFARWIKSFAYYNSRLSNAQVQALATVARPPILNLDLTAQDTRLNWGTSDRGTNATQYDSLGRLVWAPANMLSYSETAAQWNTSGLTSAAYDSTTPPTGAIQTVKVLAAAGAGNHCGYRTYTSGVAGATYTFSVFVKAGNQPYIVVGDLGDAAWHTVTIDSSTGAVTNSNSISAPTSTSLGNGWFRVSGSFTRTNAGNISVFVGAVLANLTTPGYTAGGTEYCYATGLMLEPTDVSSPKPYIPTLATAVYKPRFDYDPATLTALGFLMEEQRTNSLTYSEDFSNGAWTKTSTSITPNSAVAPTGFITADTVTASGSNGNVGQNFTYTVSTTYTFSVWIKRKTGSGAITISANSNETSGAVQAVTNDWTRFSHTCTSTVTTGAPYIKLATSGDEVYIWGAQLETGAFATSYIPTYGASATRNADPAPFLPVGSWYYQGGGTLKAQYRMVGKNTSSAQGVVAISDGTINNNWQVYNRWVSGSTNASSMLVVTGAVNQAYFDVVSSLSAGVDYKIVAQATANSFKSTQTGATIQSDLSGTMPTGMTQLVIGSIYTYASSYPANGWIKSVSYNLKFDFSDGLLQSMVV